jgi:hypothetical protein
VRVVYQGLRLSSNYPSPLPGRITLTASLSSNRRYERSYFDIPGPRNWRGLKRIIREY